jgi:hypothetical protein
LSGSRSLGRGGAAGWLWRATRRSSCCRVSKRAAWL